MREGARQSWRDQSVQVRPGNGQWSREHNWCKVEAFSEMIIPLSVRRIVWKPQDFRILLLFAVRSHNGRGRPRQGVASDQAGEKRLEAGREAWTSSVIK